ncbi:hypothetical protein Cni_G27196 [Canna indica]|uniref:HMA domain-containing protein n=1 Tax=Canna indica TaxID=4628 RepID=A0AAQ3L528_9LILI|nr:hypothetical protein Cni_G27196 [Canna indica]
MAVKKIVLKVNILCSKCKICVMTTISKFDGITSVALDAEKSTATIVGEVDAVLIVKALRKVKKGAEIVSVGKPDKKKEEEEKKKEEYCKLPPCCNACRAYVGWHDDYYYPISGCIIRINFRMETAVGKAKYECLLFDMDDTLYPLSLGINLACRKNIEDYMLHHLQIEESQVPKMCLELYKEFGTTMAGLKALGFEFDNDEFHAYAHGRLPYETVKPDPLLRNLLLSMPQRKIIFTNADKAHAEKVLRRLGLDDCFEGVICFETLNPPPKQNDEDNTIDDPNDRGFFTETDSNTDSESDSNTDAMNCFSGSKSASKERILCKPSLEAFEAAIRIANIDPKKTIFFDDSIRNIAAGKAAGLRTVLVGRSEVMAGADVALESIHNIREALPEIWQDGEQLEPVLASTAVEAIVIA